MITIAGPLLRLTPERIKVLGRPLMEAAEVALAGATSPLFTMRARG